jgi:hypothetical protein
VGKRGLIRAGDIGHDPLQWLRDRVGYGDRTGSIDWNVFINAPTSAEPAEEVALREIVNPHPCVAGYPSVASHDGVLRTKDGAPRCMAAYPSGCRCPRRARVRGMCIRCLRRAAPVWDRRYPRGATK